MGGSDSDDEQVSDGHNRRVAPPSFPPPPPSQQQQSHVSVQSIPTYNPAGYSYNVPSLDVGSLVFLRGGPNPHNQEPPPVGETSWGMPPPLHPSLMSPYWNQHNMSLAVNAPKRSRSLASQGSDQAEKKAKAAVDESFVIHVQSLQGAITNVEFERGRWNNLKDYDAHLSQFLEIPEKDRKDLQWIRTTNDRRGLLVTALEKIVPNTEETPYTLVPKRLGLIPKVVCQLYYFQSRARMLWQSLTLDNEVSVETLAKGFRRLLSANPALNFANGDVPTLDQLKAAFEGDETAQLFFDALKRQRGKLLLFLILVNKRARTSIDGLVVLGIPSNYLVYPKITCAGSVKSYKKTLAKSNIREIDMRGSRSIVARTVQTFALRLLGLEQENALPYIDPEKLNACVAFAQDIDAKHAELEQCLQVCNEHREQNHPKCATIMGEMLQKLQNLRQQHQANSATVSGQTIAELLRNTFATLGPEHVSRRLNRLRSNQNELSYARFAYNQIIACAAEKAIALAPTNTSFEFNVEFDCNWCTRVLIYDEKIEEYFRVTLKPDAFITANICDFKSTASFLVVALEEKVTEESFAENKNKCALMACMIWKQLQNLCLDRLPVPIPFVTIHRNTLQVFTLYHQHADMQCDAGLEFDFKSPTDAAQCKQLDFLQFSNPEDVHDSTKLETIQFRFQIVKEFDLTNAGNCGEAIVAMYNLFQYCIALFANVPKPNSDWYAEIDGVSVRSVKASDKEWSAATTRNGAPGGESGITGSSKTSGTSGTGGSNGAGANRLSTAMVQQTLPSVSRTFAENAIDVTTLEFPVQEDGRIIVARSSACNPPVYCKFARMGDDRMMRERRILKEIMETMGPCQGIQRLLTMNGFCGDKLQVLVTEDAGTSRFRVKTPAQFVEYCRQLVQAVQTLHRAGWVHSDISPANVCVKKNRNGGGLVVTLIDFEFAKRLDPRRNGVTKNTYPYNGTRHYAAPELRALNRDKGEEIAYTVKMDMYSVGKVLEKVLREFPSVSNPGAWEFVGRLIAFESSTRLNAEEALHHPFMEPSSQYPTPPDSRRGSG